MNKKDLWLRLKAYQFDHIVTPGVRDHITARFGKINPSLQAFAGKLARKHHWKNQFALRALSEYKKFVYLGLVSDFQVTPSKIIDVVWHEHMLFTKAYRDFCTDVINAPFDHYPELISLPGQTGIFQAQYHDTVNLYRTEFNTAPPPGIWGDTKFANEQPVMDGYQSNKKKRDTPITDGGYYNDPTPLYANFENDQPGAFPEFSDFGDGDFGGAGASGDWGDSSSSDSSSDGGDGGSCSGGCSGGCGGGD